MVEQKPNHSEEFENIGAGKYMLFGIVAVIGTIFVLAFFYNSNSVSVPSKLSAITGFVTFEDIKNEVPTYTNVEATVYYTPSFEDHGSWCSSEKGACFLNDQDVSSVAGSCDVSANHYCCIPEDKRGFYEDVKCQGSGVYKGNVYHTSTIKSTLEQSFPIVGNFKNGRTSIGKDPQPHRTVAVNARKGTPCYIPYGTKMYVYFGEGNPWNGEYVAEDTGSAFSGKCKMDFYAGVGKTANEEAANWISGKFPKIYLLDDESKVIKEDAADKKGISSSSGVLASKYSYELKLSNFSDLYENTYKFVEHLVNTCKTKTSLSEKESCINATTSNTTKFGINITRDCELKDDLISDDRKELIRLANQLSECSTTKTDCLCKVTLVDEKDSVNFYENMISFGDPAIDPYVDMTAQFYLQKKLVAGIKPGDEPPFEYVPESEELKFKVNSTSIVAVTEEKESLPACVPEKKVVLLCSSSIQTKDSKDTLPPEHQPVLKFALKI